MTLVNLVVVLLEIVVYNHVVCKVSQFYLFLSNLYAFICLFLPCCTGRAPSIIMNGSIEISNLLEFCSFYCKYFGY